MSNVIAFPAERRTTPQTAAPSGRAQILWFTGIRYIRDEVEAQAATPAPRPTALPAGEDRLQA